MRWFSATEVGDGIVLVTEPHAAEFIRGNLFIVDCGTETLFVDSGLGLCPLASEFAQQFERPPTLLLTHAHNDHRGGANEFSERIAHPLEQEVLSSRVHGRTRPKDWPPENLVAARDAGYSFPAYMLDATPHELFDPDEYWIEPAPATRLVGEGDELVVGDRMFQILHLPGHTPGGIGLLEEQTGAFFSGDMLYDGPLVDSLPESDVSDFCSSVRRIRELPLTMLHGGHGPSVGRETMVSLADRYLAGAGSDSGDPR